MEWTDEERSVARKIAQAVYGSSYRNLAVVKRLACLAAAKRLIQTERSMGLNLVEAA